MRIPETLSFWQAAGATELWSDLLRTWEGFRSNGHCLSASGTELIVSPPVVGPSYVEADRQYDVLVGAISPANCTVTLTTPWYPHQLNRLQLKRGIPGLILHNNCIPMFALNCHIRVHDIHPGFQVVYANLARTPARTDLGLPAVIVNRFIVDIVLRRRANRDIAKKRTILADRIRSIVLPSYVPWQVMVERKRHWLKQLEGELMAAACHPRRLLQILDQDEVVSLDL